MTATKSTNRARTNGITAVVADDSQFMRTVITGLLEDHGIDVVEIAADGAAAVKAVRKHRPDVVTMDLEMPNVGGIEAVERIMAEQPTPILVLSAHTDKGAKRTFEAMESGAVDFFQKPSGEVSVGLQGQADSLIAKVESVVEADLTEVTTARGPSMSTSRVHSTADYREEPTLVVGSSTGGPGVVERLLTELPLAADFRGLVVQHMPDGFTSRFAERLDEASEYDIREATDGDRIGGGEVLVAKGDHHLHVSGYGGGRLRVSLSDDEPIQNVRPSVNVTLKSAAQRVDGPLTAAILTGMGSDGAEGVEAVSDAGGTVIAQDEDTSAVFGMPRRAIETGAVDDIRPGSELAAGVLDTITTES
jgi:two-component system chemotaxis response regulator CheB